MCGDVAVVSRPVRPLEVGGAGFALFIPLVVKLGVCFVYMLLC